MKILLLSLIVSCLLACATSPPSKPITQAPENDISLQEVQKTFQRFLQSPVRWGGRILSVIDVDDDQGSYVELQILEHPLDAQGKPLATASSGGRFIARIPSPFEVTRYRRGRMVTISGVLSGVKALPLVAKVRQTKTEQTKTEQTLALVDTHHHYVWRGRVWRGRASGGAYREHEYYEHHWWPYIYYRYGIKYRRGRSGLGIIFHPKRIKAY